MKQDTLAEKLVHLSHKRTEMANERNILAYLTSATTLILFGIAFIGYGKEGHTFFYYTGFGAITVAILFMAVALVRTIHHSREIRRIKTFIEGAMLRKQHK